jgi:hypothetical protein
LLVELSIALLTGIFANHWLMLRIKGIEILLAGDDWRIRGQTQIYIVVCKQRARRVPFLA